MRVRRRLYSFGLGGKIMINRKWDTADHILPHVIILFMGIEEPRTSMAKSAKGVGNYRNGVRKEEKTSRRGTPYTAIR